MLTTVFVTLTYSAFGQHWLDESLEILWPCRALDVLLPHVVEAGMPLLYLFAFGYMTFMPPGQGGGGLLGIGSNFSLLSILTGLGQLSRSCLKSQVLGGQDCSSMVLEAATIIRCAAAEGGVRKTVSRLANTP